MPKKSALRERGTGCVSTRGVSSELSREWMEVSDLSDEDRVGGLGGGRGVGEPSAKGDPKNAWVLLVLEVREKAGEGRGDGTCTSDNEDETDEAEVRTLRREERGEEEPDDVDGTRNWWCWLWTLQLSIMSREM